MTSTLDKIRSGTRMLLDADLWRIILREARSGKRKCEGVAEAAIVETDESAGLHRIAIGAHSYWVPRSMGTAGFQMIHSEVFCENHPHHYEFRGCRIRPGDVVVDAGACEGFFTRIALERGARVIAVEPWGPMAEGLRRTFAAEIAAGTVVIAQTLLHDKVEPATLIVNTVSPWGATMYNGGAIALGEVPEAVPGTTLDALVTSSPWGRCDFLKMDVEGAERKAVAGALRHNRKRPSLPVDRRVPPRHGLRRYPSRSPFLRPELRGRRQRVAATGTLLPDDHACLAIHTSESGSVDRRSSASFNDYRGKH